MNYQENPELSQAEPSAQSPSTNKTSVIAAKIYVDAVSIVSIHFGPFQFCLIFYTWPHYFFRVKNCIKNCIKIKLYKT